MSEKQGNPRLKWAGFILTSCFLLALNALWLQTGDVRGPAGSFTMRGDWFGFWVTTVGGVLVIVYGTFRIMRGGKDRNDPTT
jgi:hypothetical protein